MATSPKFPDEVWLCIADELPLLPDILHLSLSCTCLRDTLAERLYNIQEQLRREYRSFDANGTEKEDYFTWHVLLLKILRGEIPPSYLVEVISYLDLALCDDVDESRSYTGTPCLSIDDEQRIRCAVDSSPWIYANEAQEYCRKINLGDEDAVMCVLIPLLTNLRRFSPPINTVMLPVVIGRIATASVKQLEEANSLGREPGQNVMLPLHRLVLVTSFAHSENDYGISLEGIAPFAALPSVRRIRVQAARDEIFTGWPEGLPLSRVPEVYFADSSVTIAAVREFAKGFEGPCRMRQDWGFHGGRDFGSADLEWDHYDIAGEIDANTGRIIGGSRRETMETKYRRAQHDYMRTYCYGHATYKRMSVYSDGMNAIFDGSLFDWKALIQ